MHSGFYVMASMKVLYAELYIIRLQLLEVRGSIEVRYSAAASEQAAQIISTQLQESGWILLSHPPFVKRLN